MKRWLSIRQISVLEVILVLFASVVVHAQAQTLDKLIVYVWDFSMRDGEKNSLTKNLSDEFEEALIQSQRHIVLERRKYDRLLSQKDNERAILKIEGLSPTMLNSLKAYQANTVVFGEVYDDFESGQIKVTVIFQKFDGIKLAQQSVLFSHGKQYDAESRKNAMQELIRSLESSSSTEKYLPTQNTKWFKATVTKVVVQPDGNVVVFFEYVNKTDENYQICLYGLSTQWQTKTYMVDNVGNIFEAMTLSGIEFGCYYYGQRGLPMIAGGTATFSIVFKRPRTFKEQGSSYSLSSAQSVGRIGADGRWRTVSDVNISLRDLIPNQ